MIQRPISRGSVALLFFPLVVGLAGCDRASDPKSATQVAAQVNSDEITIHQVNAILARSIGLTPESAPRAKREALERLIEQRLAVQEAQRKKLDRSPAVLQALEGARAEILARAYAEEVARGVPKPNADEVKQFYTEHPELFGHRRVFVLEEIEMAGDQDAAAALREFAPKARTMAEIAALLRARGAQFAESRGVRTAEQVPLEVLPRLQTMKEGEIQVIERDGGRLQVLRVVAAKPAPVDEAAAAPRIEHFLFNRRASEAVARQMKQVRDSAEIRYLGEFAVLSPVPDARAGRGDSAAK